MKIKNNLLFAGFLVLVNFSGYAFGLTSCPANDKDLVTKAEALFQKSNQLLEKGVISKTEAAKAQLVYEEIKFCTKTSSKSDFCNTTLPLVEDLSKSDRRIGYADQITFLES